MNGFDTLGGAVPVDAILEGHNRDHPVQTILSGTSYVHVGTGVLVNRQENADAAVDAAHVHYLDPVAAHGLPALAMASNRDDP